MFCDHYVLGFEFSEFRISAPLEVWESLIPTSRFGLPSVVANNRVRMFRGKLVPDGFGNQKWAKAESAAVGKRIAAALSRSLIS